MLSREKWVNVVFGIGDEVGFGLKELLLPSSHSMMALSRLGVRQDSPVHPSGVRALLPHQRLRTEQRCRSGQSPKEEDMGWANQGEDGRAGQAEACNLRRGHECGSQRDRFVSFYSLFYLHTDYLSYVSDLRNPASNRNKTAGFTGEHSLPSHI